MRVKLATQVLSYTAAASLCMYASLGGLPSTAMGTAEFVLKFDSVFDCVNCSTLHSTKKLKCPLNDISPNKEFMKEAINFIKGLKVFNGNEDVTSRIKYLNLRTLPWWQNDHGLRGCTLIMPPLFWL